jgi:hypothetical protein
MLGLCPSCHRVLSVDGRLVSFDDRQERQGHQLRRQCYSTRTGKTEEEKTAIGAKASAIAGADNVNNQLEIAGQ